MRDELKEATYKEQLYYNW